MLKAYLITIILFHLSFALNIMRWLYNKDSIVLKVNNEGKFTLIRLVAIGCMPIINLIFTFIFIYYSIFAKSEKFIEFMNH